MTLGVVFGCARDDLRTVVTGTLPDGTRYELRVPPGYDIGAVEGIHGVPVWADGAESGHAIGVTRFTYVDLLPADTPTDRTTVSDGRLLAPAGRWAMDIELYEHSISRAAELAQITAEDHEGMIVVSLPPSLRFGKPDELPAQTEVRYRDLSVVRGCRTGAQCSSDGEIMIFVEDPSKASEVPLGEMTIRVVG